MEEIQMSFPDYIPRVPLYLWRTNTALKARVAFSWMLAAAATHSLDQIITRIANNGYTCCSATKALSLKNEHSFNLDGFFFAILQHLLIMLALTKWFATLFYKMAWLTRNKSLQNASVCYKNAPVMEQWKCTQGWTFDFNWYFSSQKTAIPPDAKKGGILNPNGKSALTNKFLFVYCCAVFPKVFFYTCPFPIGKSYHWTIGPWPSLQGAFSVQKDHRIARFEEFLLTCEIRCFSFKYTTGTQQESAQHAQFCICTSFTLTYFAHLWSTSLVAMWI